MSHLRTLSLVIALTAAIGSAACGSSGQGGDEPLSFTEDDETVEVETGDRFEIVLDGNPTTGYSWQVAQAPDPEVVEVLDDTYVPDEAEDGVVGSGGRFVFELRAVGPGSTSVELVYEQASAGIGETATFDIDVR